MLSHLDSITKQNSRLVSSISTIVFYLYNGIFKIRRFTYSKVEASALKAEIMNNENLQRVIRKFIERQLLPEIGCCLTRNARARRALVTIMPSSPTGVIFAR